MFYVGQTVECVDYHGDECEWEIPAYWQFPVIGNKYTISNIYTAHDGYVMLELFELYAPESEIWYAGFYAMDFRPIQECKTDISVFTDLLIPVKEDA